MRTIRGAAAEMRAYHVVDLEGVDLVLADVLDGKEEVLRVPLRVGVVVYYQMVVELLARENFPEVPALEVGVKHELV